MTLAIYAINTWKTKYIILKLPTWKHKTMQHIMPPGASVISHYKQFWKSASSDSKGGCVHLDVCWIDQSTSLPSGL